MKSASSGEARCSIRDFDQSMMPMYQMSDVVGEDLIQNYYRSFLSTKFGLERFLSSPLYLIKTCENFITQER